MAESSGISKRPPVNKWLVTLSVTFGTLMGTIDTSIVNVATPHLRGSLGATVEEITWVTTGFVIANVVVMPLTAFVGRFFGQQRVYMFALALLAVGVATLQSVLEEGPRNDWFDSRTIATVALVSAFTIAAFVIRELTTPVPAVNLTLFRDPVFTSGTLVGAVMFAMLLSITFLLPVFMEELLGFTAVQARVALMPRSLVMMVGMPIVGRIYYRMSPDLT